MIKNTSKNKFSLVYLFRNSGGYFCVYNHNNYRILIKYKYLMSIFAKLFFILNYYSRIDD